MELEERRRERQRERENIGEWEWEEREREKEEDFFAEIKIQVKKNGHTNLFLSRFRPLNFDAAHLTLLFKRWKNIAKDFPQENGLVV